MWGVAGTRGMRAVWPEASNGLLCCVPPCSLISCRSTDREFWNCNGSYVSGLHLHPQTPPGCAVPQQQKSPTHTYSLGTLGPFPSSLWLRLLHPIQAACCRHWWVLIIKLLMLDLNAGRELTVWIHMFRWLCFSEPISFFANLTCCWEYLKKNHLRAFVAAHLLSLFLFSWLTLLSVLFFFSL